MGKEPGRCVLPRDDPQQGKRCEQQHGGGHHPKVVCDQHQPGHGVRSLVQGGRAQLAHRVQKRGREGMQPSRIWVRRLALGLLFPDLPKLVAADLAAVFGRIRLFDNRLEPSCLSVVRIAYGPTLVKEKAVRLVVPVHRVVIRAVRGKRHERGEKDDPRDRGEHGQHPASSGQKDVGPEVGNAVHGSASQSDSHAARRAQRGRGARADLCSHDRRVHIVPPRWRAWRCASRATRTLIGHGRALD